MAVLRTLMLLCCLLMLSLEAAAASPIVDLNQAERDIVSLTDLVDVLEDPSGALSLAEVQTAGVAKRFAASQSHGEALNYGFTHSAYWLRLTIRNNGDQAVERIFEIRNPLLSSVQLYQSAPDGSYSVLHTGVSTPFATRPYRNRAFVFPLLLAPHTDRIIYLRLQSIGAMVVPAKLWTLPAFHVHERDDYVMQSWYFGMASAIILFNLLLFFALRDVVYLLYICFAICMALTIASANGWAKEFLWPASVWWANFAPGVFGHWAYAALLFFMRRMLNTEASVPRFDRLIRIFIGIHLLISIGFAVSIDHFIIPSVMFIYASSILILTVCAVCALAKRQRIALIFLCAVIMLLLGVSAVLVLDLKLLPSNVLTMNGFQIGSALEMLMLAFALAYRFNLIRSHATQEVRQANASLEQRLQAREAELLQSHERLRKIEHHQTLSQERQRLMQDMHDGMGSSLVSALRVAERGELGVAEVARVLKGCIDDLKLAIDSMEPVDADLLLLLATLRFRLGPRLQSTGIALRWQVRDVPTLDWLDPRNSLHILRILQEAFSNIIQHTNATEIRVATAVERDGVTVTIADNGPGFSVQSALERGGKGLSNQRRRAQAIGATIGWESDGTGASVVLWLPISRPAA